MDDVDPGDEGSYEESDALIDDALAAGDGDETSSSRQVDKFRRTAAGSVVAAGLLGLRDALEGRPEKEETAVVVDAPTPKQHGRVEVTLDFDNPDRSRVVIRRPPEPPEPPPE